MRGHTGAVVATMVVLVAACGGGDDDGTSSSLADPTTPTPTASSPAPDTAPPSPGSEPSTPTSPPASAPSSAPASPPSSTPSPTSEPAGETGDAPHLLVADHEGVWLTSADGGWTQLVDGAVRWALPDRVGGVLYQRVETGTWRPVTTPSTPSTAEWSWVGSGAARPIWRLQPGAEPRIVVDAPADGRLELVDTAIVDGHPAVAFLRTRHVTITTTEEGRNPWWDSAVAELVLRDLETGVERVLRSQSVGWEHDERTPSSGARLALEVVHDYAGESHRVELLSFDGAVLDPGFPLPSCGPGCELVADLPPTGDTLVSARTEPGRDTDPATAVEVVAMGVADGLERQRVTITPDQAAVTVFVDTVDDHTLLLVGRDSTPADRPTLSPGDRGPWVQVVQDRLSDGDTHLVADGIFGPRTEAAVRALQAADDLPVTGIVDAATWDRLGLPILVDDDLVVIDPAGRVTSIVLDRSSAPRPRPSRPGPAITLWSGPDWPIAAAEGAGALGLRTSDLAALRTPPRRLPTAG